MDRRLGRAHHFLRRRNRAQKLDLPYSYLNRTNVSTDVISLRALRTDVLGENEVLTKKS